MGREFIQFHNKLMIQNLWTLTGSLLDRGALPLETTCNVSLTSKQTSSARQLTVRIIYQLATRISYLSRELSVSAFNSTGVSWNTNNGLMVTECESVPKRCLITCWSLNRPDPFGWNAVRFSCRFQCAGAACQPFHWAGRYLRLACRCLPRTRAISTDETSMRLFKYLRKSSFLRPKFLCSPSDPARTGRSCTTMSTLDLLAWV